MRGDLSPGGFTPVSEQERHPGAPAKMEGEEKGHSTTYVRKRSR